MRRLVFLFLLIAFPLNAQSLTPYLLPVPPAASVPGANGSLWKTQLVVENSSDHDIVLLASACMVCSPPAPNVTVPAQSATTIDTLAWFGGSSGGYVFVDSNDAPFLRMHLRVRDLSRQAETYGTEIPIVPQAAFQTSMRLIDVPTDPRFRVTLRIFASVLGPDSATVTVLPPNGTTPLRTIPVALRYGVAQLDPVSGLTDPLVRIVVDSSGPIWAFASVTNNATQDVTTITEMRRSLDAGNAQYLLPLLPMQNVAGERGSIWNTDFAAENTSDAWITLYHYGCILCGAPPPPGRPVTVPPRGTAVDPPDVPQNIAIGTYVWILDQDVSAVRMHLRVRDMSRESDSFGTEIPVVPRSAFRFTNRLIDVPTDPRFRLNLRIYADASDVQARVTILPATGTTPLARGIVTLQNSAAHLDPMQWITTTEPSIRIVVEGVDQVPVWAFVSVTNNDTQDVTTITESP